MQLLMRRPEIEGVVAIAAPANRFDFSFLAPCPGRVPRDGVAGRKQAAREARFS